MARVWTALDGKGHRRVGFDCPGCKDVHMIPVEGPNAWGFNGSMERPTLNPSILVTSKLLVDGAIRVFVCHSFLREGSLVFLDDCTHEMKGQTIELAEVRDA